jgi:hypothetical protein
MTDSIQAMSDLACVKEIIETLSSENQKELFKHFTTSLNNSSTTVRPTTPLTSQSEISTSKRLLNSPESPKRSKKDNKVTIYIIKILMLSDSV